MFKILTYSSALSILGLLALIVISLVLGSSPILLDYPLLLTADWSPGTDEYGIWAPVLGTFLSAIIAIALATPLALAVAFALTEYIPLFLRKPLRIGIELLAAIPSIIYGMWGFFVFIPFFRAWIQPFLIEYLSPLPGIGMFFTGPSLGYSVLTAGIILSLMILPFITSVMQEVFATVPPLLKESAYGLGATRWEVCRNVLLPYSRVGMVGAITLGLGRAIGETMAVAFVIGSATSVSTSIIANGRSITSSLALEFQEASDMHTSALLTLGLLLFCITTFILISTKAWMFYLQKKGV